MKKICQKQTFCCLVFVAEIRPVGRQFYFVRENFENKGTFFWSFFMLFFLAEKVRKTTLKDHFSFSTKSLVQPWPDRLRRPWRWCAVGHYSFLLLGNDFTTPVFKKPQKEAFITFWKKTKKENLWE